MEINTPNIRKSNKYSSI